MTNKKQSAKRLKQSQKNRSLNRRYLSLIKSSVKTALMQASSKHDDHYSLFLSPVQSRIDKAVKRNVIKKRKGMRLKRKIASQLKSVSHG